LNLKPHVRVGVSALAALYFTLGKIERNDRVSEATNVCSNRAVTGSGIKDGAFSGGQTRRNPSPTIEDHRITEDQQPANPEIRYLTRQPEPAFDSM
jgi:hypothetical protein